MPTSLRSPKHSLSCKCSFWWVSSDSCLVRALLSPACGVRFPVLGPGVHTGTLSWEAGPLPRAGPGARPRSCTGIQRLGEAWPGPAPVRCPQAYLKWMADGGKDQLLPGLELTYDQLFFINYAQVAA